MAAVEGWTRVGDARAHLLLLQLLAVLEVTSLARAYPSGAPPDACVTLLPRHVGIRVQTSPSPYRVSVSGRHYSPGQPLKVAIEGAVFAAFVLQARTRATNDSAGVFSPPPATRAMSCQSRGDTLTHISPDPKSRLEVSWYPPGDDLGDIEILATVAESKFRYWGVLHSPVLTYVKASPKHNEGSGGGMSLSSVSAAVIVAAALAMSWLQ